MIKQMLRDKHNYKVKSIIKMQNKIGNKRVFAPHDQHLETQVKLGIWSSMSRKSCLEDWGIFFEGAKKMSTIVRTKALEPKVHGKNMTP